MRPGLIPTTTEARSNFRPVAQPERGAGLAVIAAVEASLELVPVQLRLAANPGPIEPALLDTASFLVRVRNLSQTGPI